MPLRSIFLCLCLSVWAHSVPAQGIPAEQQLAAAEAAMNIGDDRRAEALLSRLPPQSLNLPQLGRSQIVRAEISLKRELPAAALQALPIGSDHLPARTAERVEELRGRALFKLGDPVAAVRSLCLRERYLVGDAAAIRENRDAIWQGLLQTPLSRHDTAQIATQDSLTRGWLELAVLMQQGGTPRLDDWRARYPGHPAAPRATSARGAAPVPANSGFGAGVANPAAPIAPIAGGGGFAPPAGSVVGVPLPPPRVSGGRGYALLLPLTGAYAATATAVRDGFMSAYQDGGGTDQSPVRIYDTGTGPEQLMSAYQDALRDGPSMIVGPLSKDAVASIARLGTPPVPVIALNYLDPGTAPPQFLQLGLAPEDEARAAAEQAYSQGRQRAAVLVPDSDWGERVSSAFDQQLRSRGGAVVTSQRFQAGAPDHSNVVRRLLSFDASENRHKALTGVLGKETEFEARRRADIDFIFVAAKPSDGRVILPLLRFYRAGDLPVYSTSLIYDGQVTDDTRSLSICDMPWMIDSQGSWAGTRAATQSQFGDAMRDYPRLVALGADSYRVARRVVDGRLTSSDSIEGASGRLHLGDEGRFVRDVGCVKLSSIKPASANE